MIEIKTKYPGEAWLKAAQEVIKNGVIIKDGDQNLKEILNVFISVENPLGKDSVLEKYADPTMISWMKDNFLKKVPVLDWGYSYGQRFFSYKGVDQVSRVIEKLQSNPESKSAIISLMDPESDIRHVPCIVAIDFKIRGDKLITTCFFRSQDAGKKIYADIIAIGEISKLIAEKVGVNPGNVNLLVVSLHAYEKEWGKIKEMAATIEQ